MIRSGAWLLSAALVLALSAVAVLLSLGSPDAVLNDVPPSAPSDPHKRATSSSSKSPPAQPPNKSPTNSSAAASSPPPGSSKPSSVSSATRIGWSSALRLRARPTHHRRHRTHPQRRHLRTRRHHSRGLAGRRDLRPHRPGHPATVAQLQAAAADPSVAVGTLAGNRPQGASLEGYLFPAPTSSPASPMAKT